MVLVRQVGLEEELCKQILQEAEVLQRNAWDAANIKT